jgi:hypothetical protein
VAVLGFTGFQISVVFVWGVVAGGGLTSFAVVAFAGVVVVVGFVYVAFFACSNF